jgi:cellulose synthase/poly-beta-1,6-N-acetylglucosamine synthase-like glycosyltransferase
MTSADLRALVSDVAVFGIVAFGLSLLLTPYVTRLLVRLTVVSARRPPQRIPMLKLSGVVLAISFFLALFLLCREAGADASSAKGVGRWCILVTRGFSGEGSRGGLSVAKAAFWLSFAVPSYVYFGYPVLLFISRRLSRYHVRRGLSEPLSPLVIFVAAHNEECVLARKLENLLGLEYPGERRIVVVSDGSTDRTDTIAENYASRGVELFRTGRRVGKSEALNLAMRAVEPGGIHVLTDADCVFGHDALLRLAERFADPEVGLCCGSFCHTNPDEPVVAAGEDLYFRYDKALRLWESQAGSTIVASGAIYAVRPELWRHVPAGLSDDSYIPLGVLAAGRRVVYEPSAVCWGAASEDAADEFYRKVRMVVRSLPSGFRWKLLAVPPRPGPAVRYVSHKLLRWFVPCFLVAGFFSNLALVRHPFYLFAFFAQALFYAAAGLGAFGSSCGFKPRWLMTPFHFCLVNAASLMGVIQVMSLSDFAVWTPPMAGRVSTETLSLPLASAPGTGPTADLEATTTD